MRKRFVTLEDVAAAAHMSRAQVSRALRGDPGVKPDVRAHIAQVAAQLDYRPNIAARALVSARAATVGVVIGDVTNPFHIQLAQAVDAELAKTDLDPVVSLRAIDDAAALREIERLLRLRAAGVILLATPHGTAALGAIADRLPVVYIGARRAGGEQVTTIGIDDAGGVEAAIAHLLALGHTRIAHIAGQDEASARERTAAYRAAMLAAGLAPQVVHGRHDVASGRAGVDALLQGALAPTAIFASNDMIALGVLDRLQGLGMRVPEDISVIGFDDIPGAGDEVLSLSTIRQDTEQQATAAVQALQALIDGTQAPGAYHVLPVRLVLRRSVAPPRAA